MHATEIGAWMCEVRWERSLRRGRVICSPERKWWRSLSRRLGKPVGRREAEFAAKAQQKRGFDVDANSIDRYDARPAVELRQADPEISVGAAVKVYAVAEEHGLWSRGYGSPHSPPAPFIRQMLRKKVGEEKIADIYGVCGVRPSANPVRRVRTAKAIYRIGKQMLPGTQVQFGQAFRAKHIERLADKFGYRGFLAGLGALEVYIPSDPDGDYRWQISGIRYADSRPDQSGIEMYYKRVQELLKLPLWELRQRYASPKKNWAAMGIEVGNVTVAPIKGQSTKLVKQLLADIQPADIDNEVLGNVTRLVGAFGALAPKWVAVNGNLHDAAQCVPPKRCWTEVAVWIAANGSWVLQNPKLAMPCIRMWCPDFAGKKPVEVRTMVEAMRYANLPLALQDAAVDVRLSFDENAQVSFEKWARRIREEAPNYETIPPVFVEIEGRTLTSLKRGDPIGPWLGEATNCCQHIGGVGSSCAKHGALNPEGGFWVVRDSSKKIVAQSWVWRSGDVVAADNVEALGGYHWLPALYKAAAEAILGRLGIKEVRVGNNSDMDVSEFKEVKSVASPKGCYTDAHSQRLLARKESQ